MNLCSVTKSKLVIPVQVGSPITFLGIIIISLDIRSNRDDITTAMLSQKIGRISEYKEVKMLHRINKKVSLEFNLRAYPAVKPRRVHSPAFRFSNLHSFTVYFSRM